MKERLREGELAPDFSALAIGGEFLEPTTVRLSELRGQVVVLVFYPKDDTPGCTKQACEVRDGWTELSGKAKIFGVSVDSVESHQKFLGKYGLPYPLLSDADKTIVSDYGVWVEKSLYGNKYMGTERSTFVVDESGVIRAVLPKIAPGKHFRKLLATLEGLPNAP